MRKWPRGNGIFKKWQKALFPVERQLNLCDNGKSRHFTKMLQLKQSQAQLFDAQRGNTLHICEKAERTIARSTIKITAQ